MDDVKRPIKFKPLGCHCQQPHCFNGHAWIALGTILDLKAPTYADLRNRVCNNGTEWIQPQMKEFLSQKLYENNEEYSPLKKLLINAEMSIRESANKALQKGFLIFNKIRHK